MASKNTKNTAEGDVLIIDELSKHLNYNEIEKKFLVELAKKGIIAVETLLEEAISKVSGIKRSIKNGEDFADGTDAKKATVTLNDASDGSRMCRIDCGGKIGALRVMISEPLTKELFYFIIPHKEIVGKSAIKIAFDREGGIPRKIADKIGGRKFNIWGQPINRPTSFNQRAWMLYRVESFEDLCCIETTASQIFLD